MKDVFLEEIREEYEEVREDYYESLQVCAIIRVLAVFKQILCDFMFIYSRHVEKRLIVAANVECL